MHMLTASDRQSVKDASSAGEKLCTSRSRLECTQHMRIWPSGLTLPSFGMAPSGVRPLSRHVQSGTDVGSAEQEHRKHTAALLLAVPWWNVVEVRTLPCCPVGRHAFLDIEQQLLSVQCLSSNAVDSGASARLSPS